MVATMLPVAPEPWATAPATDSALLLGQLATLRLENAALRAQNAVLQAAVVNKELQQRLIPLRARLGRLLRRGQENADRKAAGLCRELTKWWRALRTFARVEGVEPTNNVAERALRPAVLWREGSFGSDSEAGSRFAERLLTVVATCRQQGRRLLEFLAAAGEAALQGTAAPSLLPTRPGR